MTLLITVFAAVTVTIIWYKNAPDTSMQLGTLSLMFWGASIMWFVDAVVGYMEEGASFFMQDAAEMLNDLYLGLSVVALGLIIWLVILMIKDPHRVIRSLITGTNRQ
ncbi:MAG: hypothetical protein K6E49_00905 [Lachnospiraceae bacterium]|nr:hypothetical protein [Lachnospiraceae bacterium]